MAKKQEDDEVPMTALNAEIPTTTMDMLKLAKVVHKRPIREMVQEAIDQWLKSHGITPDKMPTIGKRDR